MYSGTDPGSIQITKSSAEQHTPQITIQGREFDYSSSWIINNVRLEQMGSVNKRDRLAMIRRIWKMHQHHGVEINWCEMSKHQATFSRFHIVQANTQKLFLIWGLA